MANIRIWKNIDIEEIGKHIVIVDDRYGFCPGCKQAGLELKGLTACPNCGRVFKYAAAKDAAAASPELLSRAMQKLPNLTFVDYGDYQICTSKNAAAGLFKI